MSLRQRFWPLPVPFFTVFLLATVLISITVLREYVSHAYENPTRPFNWFFYSMTTGLNYYVWVLLCPAVYSIAVGFEGRFPREFRRIGKTVFVAASVAVAHCTISGVLGFLLHSLRDGHWVVEYLSYLVSYVQAGFFTSFIVFWVLLGILLAVDSQRRYQQKQMELANLRGELADARLNALRMQLHPHFLFNALNSVSSLMDGNPADARRMLNQIAFLLRKMLERSDGQFISLEEELQYIRSYLDIEQTRFREWMTVEYEIAEETLGARVPCLILQPLVENAVKHGLTGRTDAGHIRLSSRRFNGSLELTVEDDGPGKTIGHTVYRSDPVSVDAADASRSGSGIRIVQNRLEQLYKDRFQLHCESIDPKGFLARVRLPYEDAP